MAYRVKNTFCCPRCSLNYLTLQSNHTTTHGLTKHQMQTSAQTTTATKPTSSASSPIQGIERDLMKDLAAFARSGAFDAPECYRSAIAAMAVNHRLTLKQSRSLFRSIEKACKEAGLHYYHQRDPRGCALFVSTKPISSRDYTNGVACSI